MWIQILLLTTGKLWLNHLHTLIYLITSFKHCRGWENINIESSFFYSRGAFMGLSNTKTISICKLQMSIFRLIKLILTSSLFVAFTINISNSSALLFPNSLVLILFLLKSQNLLNRASQQGWLGERRNKAHVWYWGCLIFVYEIVVELKLVGFLRFFASKFGKCRMLTLKFTYKTDRKLFSKF